MQIIIEKIIESIESGNILLVVIFVMFSLLLNIHKIQYIIDSRKDKKIKTLKEALESKYVKNKTKKHLEDQIESEYFKLSTGVRLERNFREAIIDLHQKTNGEIRFINFKRTIPHFKYKDNKLILKITLFDKILFYFNLVSGIIIGLCGATLIILPLLFNNLFNGKIIPILALGTFFILAFILMISQTFPIISARMIDKKLTELDQKHNKTFEGKNY